MLIEEMTDPECRAMLAGRNLAHLSCALNNQPYIVPMYVDFDDQFLYGYAPLGLKIEWMRQNPLVCLEIDQVITNTRWASVVVFGRYEELPDTPEFESARMVAERLFLKRPMWWEPAASVPVADAQPRARIVFRIRIGRMTGRRGGPDAANTTDVPENPSEARRPRWLAKVLGRVRGGTPI